MWQVPMRAGRRGQRGSGDAHLLRGDGGLRDAAVLQQVLQRALVQVELVHVVLREAGNAQVVAAQHLALAQPQPAQRRTGRHTAPHCQLRSRHTRTVATV